MKAAIGLCLCLVASVCVALAAEPAPLCEPWDAAYAGADATGPHVIGLWKFDQAAPTADSSGHGHDCKLEGAKIEPQGRFGAALSSSRGYPIADQRFRALVKPAPDLSPKGAFTIDFWLQPRAELAPDYPESFLVDKKYASNDDYQIILGAADRGGNRALRAVLGFGVDIETWYSEPMAWPAGVWHHVAFTYDGEGTGAFYVDGQPRGSRTAAGRKGVSPGKHGLSIGDRIGSLYHGFPGSLDEVRLCNGVREFRRVRFNRDSGRTVYQRMETGAVVHFSIVNQQRKPLAAGKLRFAIGGLTPTEQALAEVPPGGTRVVNYTLDTSLRPDVYRLSAVLELPGRPGEQYQDRFTLSIVPRPLPDRFPVLMWGGYAKAGNELTRLKEIGFTHVLGPGADYGRLWESKEVIEPEKPEKLARNLEMLDDALTEGMTIVATLSPGHWLREKSDYLRVDRQGKADAKRPDICGLLPGVEAFCQRVGESVANAYGKHPAFGAALIHTEVRDAARPCFHAQDRDAYRKATGRDIPPEAGSRAGVEYAKLPGFPASRIIPDDHPLYLYYQWYWKQGDGWNALNGAVYRGLRTGTRPDFWTFNDPAVRVAKTYGSGGDVDVISQWTYSYPDPIRIAVATDELLAMAAGAGRKQDVMKMTQIIWYRGQTAPAAKPGQPAPSYQAQWEQDQPDAPFITIAPMQLREALWTKISRPIKGIMYHGLQSLLPTEGTAGYRYTNPETQRELARLAREVIRPLGPMLLHVPGVKNDVAFLQSFASEMFARRGTYGWCGKGAGDAYHVLMYAHLQPEIVYDETIAERGLDGYRVLVLADCDVLTQKVADQIKKFQGRGGIVVGDENLAPGIKPDLRLKSFARTGRADQDKAGLLAVAAQLRKDLDGRYHRYADSEEPNVIPYVRRSGSSDYVFLVNDRREYGQYVGQHGIVMENGLPSTARLALARATGHVYDLVAHRPVAAQVNRQHLLVANELEPCGGRLLLVTDRAIEGVRVRGPAEVARGKPVACTVEVVDPAGKPIDAVVPLEVAIRDPEGRLAEFSGYYAAVDGKLPLRFDVAANDRFGLWEISVRELAAGQVGRYYVRVLGPEAWPPARIVPAEMANPVQPKG